MGKIEKVHMADERIRDLEEVTNSRPSSLQMTGELQVLSKTQTPQLVINLVTGYFKNLLALIVKEPEPMTGTLLKMSDSNIFHIPCSKVEAPVPGNSFEYFKDHEIEQTIVSRFEEQVRKYPAKIAIYEEGTEVTYRELNSLVNGLSNAIIKSGKVAGVNIALLLEHGKTAVVGMCGVLKAGSAYVPLDPDYPFDRLRYILDDTHCNLIIACTGTNALAKKLVEEIKDGFVINIDQDIISVEENINLSITPGSLAYILYTSGSTGEPKGVMQCHRNVLHFIRCYTNNLHISADDKICLLSRYTFDSSVQDVFGALLNGSSLYTYDIKQKGITLLAEWLKINQVSIVHIVPTLYRYFLSTLTSAVFENIRLMVLGGEPLYQKDFEGFKTHFKEGSILINGYGATESTMIVQQFLNHKSVVDKTNIPVGFPVPHTEVYLLNSDDEEVGIYETGEIVCKSDFLTLGYWNKKAQTEKVFTPDPKTKSGRIYRSGDLGRKLADGRIEIMGRKDNQVKIRGWRVELSEIEQNLIKIEGVHEAIVLLKKISNEDLLVAYIRSSEKSKNNIEQALRKKVPVHMLPAVYMFVKEFPLTHSGKINRRALPDPDASELLSKEYVAPRNEVEVKLAEIWQKLLKIEKVGVDDNFFSMGGHSLLAILLQNEIKKVFHKNLPLATLLKMATIRGLASDLCQAESDKHWSSLVAIQPTGYKPPLFLVHEGTGEVFTYRNLANRLDTDRPVYGLQAQGLDGHTKPFVTIEEMAAHYIKEIESIQTEGPYFLGGLCLGGIIALEIAQQLKEKGKQVAMLIFFGTPYNILSTGRQQGTLPSGRSGYFTYLSPFASKDKLVYLIRHYWKILRRPLFSKKGHLFGNLIWERIYVNTLKALKNYKPKTYSGNLLSFWATNDRRFSAVEQSRWCNIISGDVKSYNFPRDNISHVINGPYCKNVVEILKVYLDEAECIITNENMAPARSVSEAERNTNSQTSKHELPSWSSLVPIQTKATAPLFCIHGAEDTFTGEIHYAYDLARLLGPAQSVYGLQAQGLDGRSKPHLRIENMAAYYINEIQTIQPKEPYFLCGSGFGGLVALEMAQQLNSLGKNTALVILIDSINMDQPSALSSKEIHSISKDVNMLKKIKEFKTNIKNKFLIKVCHFIKYPLPNAVIYFYLRHTFMRARRNYIAKVYKGKVAIFCSGDKPINTYEGISLNRLVNGNAEIQNTSFNQDYKDKETHMQELADKMKSSLQNAFIDSPGNLFVKNKGTNHAAKTY